MKKTGNSLKEKNKAVHSPTKPKSSVWSNDKAALLRRPASVPTAGDCNCGGK